MPEIIVSEQRKKAVELNQKIIVSAELAQKNLWDMCVSLKEMRDDKLYKELGYGNFEDYCENEVGMKRRNAYNYISIVEKVKLENVQSIAQSGMTKLSLLATISEQEQAEIAERVDLEDTTVKELKAEIDRIKKEKSRLVREIDNINTDLLQQMGINRLKDKDIEKLKSEMSSVNNQLLQQKELNYLKDHDLEKLKKSAKEKDKLIDGLKSQVEELENRPIEVAVVEPSDNERRLQETINALRADSARKNDELEKQYIEDTRNMRENFEKSKQQAIDEAVSGKQAEIDNLTYELAKAKSQNGLTHEEKEYRLAYMNAENALKALEDVINKFNIQHSEAIGLAKAFIFDLKG